MGRIILVTFVLCCISCFGNTQRYSIPSCDSEIYCQGNLLDTVQTARLYPDSKTFVDMKMKKPSSEILEEFDALMQNTNQNPTKQQIQQFVDDNFEEGNELEDWSPPDYNNRPKFLNNIDNVVLRDFARNLVRLWPILARRVRPEVIENADRYSLIPVPNGFIIPGGRFREFYYWDTYWIIQGLLISDMDESARGIIENFFSMVEKYGFIPNGGRVYYLNRSQPPLLTLMGAAYYEKTKNKEWLKSNIKYFDQELSHWINHRTAEFEKDGVKYTLGYYNTDSGSPRPESYIEDIRTAAFFDNQEDRMKCYSELKSGAEAGWDFSSRWIFSDDGRNAGNLSNIEVSRLAPVDLNAFLCKAFKTISEFYKELGDEKNSAFWAEKSTYWQKLIDQILWNEEDGIWYDYDMQLQKHRKYFYPSNVSPLWAQTFDPQNGPRLGKRVLNYLYTKKIIDYPGGIPTSLEQSGEQWDFPNAWPPLQAIVIQGLYRSGDPTAKDQAVKLAHKWIKANIRGYMDTQEMFEKYDAEVSGMYGGGGEYTVQSGFGWTNGVVLEFIHEYFSKRNSDDSDRNNNKYK